MRLVQARRNGHIGDIDWYRSIDLELLEHARDASGRFAAASASLWADDTRIYQVSRVGLRIVEPARVPAVAEAPPPLVRDDRRVDLDRLRRFWSGRTGLTGWLIEDLILAMTRGEHDQQL